MDRPLTNEEIIHEEEASQDEPPASQSIIKGPFKPSDFYCVYLLNSISRRRSFYVGSTPNPPRRLLQHNGHQSMGAKRTSKEDLRPWEMVAIVHGFPSKIVALQYERALQKPQITRFIKHHERISGSSSSSGGGNASRTVHQYLANVRLLLKCDYFRRMNLKVDFFANGGYDQVYESWIENKYGVFLGEEYQVRNSFKDVGECYLDCMGTLKKQRQKYYYNDEETVVGNEKNSDCGVCGGILAKDGIGQWRSLGCYHENCEFSGHLRCIADSFLEVETQIIKEGLKKNKNNKKNKNKNKPPGGGKSKYFGSSYSQLSQSAKLLISNQTMDKGTEGVYPILPFRGKCPSCEKMLYWNQLIKSSYPDG
ncbi:endonuclease [Saccharomycopsis crataegensis]|uniref:Endonuclease n=1 Tax=Saccharomycopsis crataegensis TaxID=43959 RepID=A0AAV5QKK3_9ASCO|nr:endonuclease [Saccharomycopsis crataegensis]